MFHKTDNEEVNTKKSGPTIAGQLLSFIGGGAVGSIVYNAYHAVKDNSEDPSPQKPKV